MSLTDSWQAFLDACTDKGLPLRDWAYALEDKGIPSLPVFAIVFLLLIGVIAMTLGSGLSLGGLTQQKGKLSIAISDLAGEPVSADAVVSISNTAAKYKADKTMTGGYVLFSDLPPGEYEISVSTDSMLLTPNKAMKTVVSGQTTSLEFQGTSLTQEQVSLYVTVRGADSAQIDVEYSSGILYDSFEGATHEFRIPKNKAFIVRASQEGYSSIEETISITDKNEQVTLTLVKNGETRESALHIGVFDENGLYGNPIENASVRVVETNTQKTLYSLRTAQDGSCDAAPVPFGATLDVVASAPGFESKNVNVNASDETVNVKIQLSRAAGAENTTIQVVDENGAAIAATLVRLYDSKNALRFEGVAPDGVLQLNPNSFGGLAGVYAVVYKPGFLPQTLSYVKKGVNKVTLREATAKNSGALTVIVTDKNGLPAAQAQVSLFDAADKFLGVPGATTGEDGVVSFEGLPAGGAIGAVNVVAAKAGRSAETQTQIEIGQSADAAIQFVAQKTRFEASVVDSATRKSVANAKITVFAGDEQASCTTAGNGKCVLEIIESDAAIAQVTASGYDDFYSDEFKLVPGAKNKREFIVTKTTTLEGKISFLGVFDENGKRASELKPLATYTARFSLAGDEASRAVAHVRVGDSVKSIGEEPIELISYSAGGARVTRGLSYDELIAQEQAAAAAAQALAGTTASASSAKSRDVVVGIYDEGFTPQDVEAVEGARVIFKNLGEKQHTVAFDEGFEGGAGSSSSVLQSNQTFIVKPPRAGSWSFHCGIHPLEMGTLNVVPATQSQENEAAAAAAGTLTGASATAFKWVEFSFEPFKGRREVSVQFKVKQRVGEKTWLEYRAAFYGEELLSQTPGVTQTVVREPVDAAAGASKAEALANAFKTPSLQIKFGGYCDNGVCVEYWFEQNGLRSKEEFNAELGKTFRVGFRALKESDAPVTLQLKTAASAAGGALALKQANLNGKTAATAASDANTSDLAVTLRDTDSTGFFEVEARRLSNDAGMQLAALDSQRNTLLNENVFLRVVSQGTPKLVVSVKPSSLIALEEKNVAFTVHNAFGTAIDDARITIEPSDESPAVLAATIEADDDAELAQRGEYRVSRVTPKGAGAVKWTVSSQGYALASGFIPVKAPAQAISVSTDALRLAVRDEGDAEGRVIVKNLVSNELRVEVSSEFFSYSKYAELVIEPTTLRLKPGENKEVTVTARLLPDAPLVSRERDRLTEKSSGVITFTATTGDFVGSGAGGTFGEDKETQFQIDLSVTQKKIDDAWTVTPQTANLEIKPEAAAAAANAALFAGEETENDAVNENAAKTFTVENRGDYAVLINHDSSVEGVFVEPLSAILQPGDSIDFIATAALPSDLPDCVMQDDKNKGTIIFYASSLGVSSKKTVTLTKTLKASESCEPGNAVSITLPLPIRLGLPQGTVDKENVDGSVTLALPNGELFWLDGGANVETQTREALLPSNTKMKVGETRAAVTQRGVTLTLPVQVIIEVPGDADAAIQGNALVVTAGNALLYLPPGLGLSEYEGMRVVVAPPNALLRFERAPISDILDRLPANGVSLSLPVEETLVLPAGSRVITQTASTQNIPTFGSSGYSAGFASLSRYQNVESIALPDGTKIAFDAGTEVERTPAALVVKIPANGRLIVPAQFVMPLTLASAQGAAGASAGGNQFMPLPSAASQSFSESYDAFVLTLPFLSIPGIPEGARFIQDKTKALYSYRLSDESVVQFNFDPRPASTTGGTLTQVRVPPMAPTFFLKGAAAQAVEDPTAISSCPQVFVPNEDVLVEFPAGTVFQASPLKAVINDCSSSNAKIKVYSKNEPDVVLYESAASKRVTIEGGKLGGTPEASDAEAGNVVEAKRGKKISFETCEKDRSGQKLSDELKQVTITVPSGTTLVLPPGARTEKVPYDIPLGGYKKIKLIGDTTYELSKTKKISVDVNTGYYSDAVRTQIEAVQKGESKQLYLPPRSQISYVPYCDAAASGTLEVRISSAALAFDPAILAFDVLNNEQKRRSKEICMKNIGVETVSLTRFEVVPDEGSKDSEKIAEFLPADSEHMKFLEATKYGGVHTGDLPGGEQCAKYVFTVEVPSSWLDKYGCIRSDVDTTLKGTVLIYAKNERGRDTEPVRLPLEIKVNGKDYDSKCGKYSASKNAAGLVEAGPVEFPKGMAGVATPTLYFKGVDGADGSHKKIVVMRNNWYGSVVIGIKTNAAGKREDSGHVACTAYDAENAGAKTPLEGAELAPGTAIAFECKSLKYTGDEQGNRGILTLTVNAKGAAGGALPLEEYPLHVVVYKPEAGVKALYKNTPLGTLKFDPNTMFLGLGEADEAAGAVASGVAKPAGESGLSFADASVKEAYSPYQDCEVEFCAANDAVIAIDSFLGATIDLAVSETKADDRYAEIARDFGAGKAWRKVMVLHLANTVATSEQIVKKISDVVEARSAELRSDGFNSDIQFSKQDAATKLAGCGIYAVTARLDPGDRSFGGVASTKEYKDRVSGFYLEVKIDKMLACEENMANLPLLMSPDETFPYIGATVVKDAPIKQLISGEIGAYSTKPDSFDLQQMSLLSEALYGIKRGLNAQGKLDASTATDFEAAKSYSDSPFCDASLNTYITMAHTASTAGCIGLALGAIYGASPKLMQFATSFCTAELESLAACGATGSIGGYTGNCDKKNYCLYLQIGNICSALVEGVIGPAGKSVSAAKTLKGVELFKQLGFTGVGGYAASALGDAVAYAAVSGLTTGFGKKTGSPALVFAGGKIAGLVTGGAIKGIANRFGGTKTSTTSTSTIRTALELSLIEKAAAEPKSPADKLKSVTGMFGKSNAIKTGAKLAGGLGCMAAATFLRVNGKPVRSEFKPDYANNILTMHFDGSTPTVNEYCYLVDEELLPNAESKNCYYEMETKNLKSVCPQQPEKTDLRGCLTVEKSPIVYTNKALQSITGYTAVLVIQPTESKKPKLDTLSVLKSIFQPEVEPVNEKVGSGFVLGDKVLEPNSIGEKRRGQTTLTESNA